MNQEQLEINVNGLTLRGNLYTPAQSKKNLAILFLHGWTGKPNEDAAKHLAENGFTSMTFSLSGHNNSDGKLEDQTRDKSLEEVFAAYGYLKSKIPADMHLGIAGNSYGGYMAAVLAGERPVACLQLRAPANYLDEHFTEKQLGQGNDNPVTMRWRHLALKPNATRSLRALHGFKNPIQIIEAEHDDMVPRQTVQNYVNAIKDKSKLDYHFMENWEHSLGDDPERNRKYQEMLLNWLERI